MNIDNLLDPAQQQQIREIALAEYESGRECCGFVLSSGEVYQCENKSNQPDIEFVIETSVYSSFDRKGVIRSIFHSHVNGNGKFTAADIDLVNRTQKPLILYDVFCNEFEVADPSGDLPLLGRKFIYGVADCFSLVRDWYKQERSIELPNYPRSSDDPVWDKKEWDWIDSEYDRAGFRPVEQPEYGDVIAMSLGANTTGINHLAVYLGEDRFIHQLNDRVSRIDIWGHPWIGYTVKFLRYFGDD